MFNMVCTLCRSLVECLTPVKTPTVIYNDYHDSWCFRCSENFAGGLLGISIVPLYLLPCSTFSLELSYLIHIFMHLQTRSTRTLQHKKCLALEPPLQIPEDRFCYEKTESHFWFAMFVLLRAASDHFYKAQISFAVQKTESRFWLAIMSWGWLFLLWKTVSLASLKLAAEKITTFIKTEASMNI